MAKLLIVQLNEYELHGLEALAGELKKDGHQIRLIIPFFEKAPLREIKEFAPDLAGFSVASVEREESLVWAKAIKSRTRALTIFGGVDPTFVPGIINNDAVDMVCRGEAEQSLARLMRALDRKEDYTGIDNLWVKREGKIFQNPVGPLTENLDTLPFPDKEIYFSHYAHFRNFPIKLFMAGRGCPFSCSYCGNSGLRHLYPNCSHYLRFKSPEYLLEEIKPVIAKYPARTIGFNDDLFSYDQKWLEQFLPRYQKEIGIPFFCTARIDLITEDKVRLLKEAGCYSMWYGLESADPEDRAKILNRKMSNRQIEAGVEILHKYGIKIQSYNMLNYPGDTLEKGIATLNFNRRLKNDFVISSLFQPFPGIKLGAPANQEQPSEGAAPETSAGKLNFFAFSSFRQQDTPRIENLHKLFILGYRSRLVFKMLPFLAKLPKNPLFDIIFLITFAWDYTRTHRLRLWETFKYNHIHIRTTYLARKAKEPRK